MNTASPVEALVTDHLDLWTTALKRKSTAGRGSSSKVELYGIKKLRELILELAVRGLLVPQDPNDEPASELLKKIAAEKAGLVKAGKIKKEKSLPPIAELEKSFELPVSWAWGHLADVFYPISVSKNKVKTSEISEEGKHPVVDQGQSFIAGYVDDDSLLNLLPGTVIVFGDHTSALKYIDFNFVAGADGVKILRPISCNERYFFLVCKTLPIESRGYGRHYSRLVDNFFPLPPLAEQHRIVAKVDELMALCDQLEQQTDASLGAHQTLVETLLSALTSAADHAQFASAWQRIAGHFDTLFTTEESIAQLKQTILQLAVMGKLVPQDPNDEPASELLKKIAAEKAKLVKEGKIKKDKPQLPIAEEEKLFKVPAGWKLVRFGDLLINRDSERIPLSVDERATRRGEYDYYGASGVIDSIDAYLFDKPLLLIGEDGANLINRSTPIAFMAYGKYWVNNHAHVLDGYSEGLLLYVCLYINAISLEPYVTGTAQPKMNQAKMNGIVVAIPPLAEQHRIVAKVDELMALCDQLKSRLSDAQTTQLHLADALVDALVEQAIG